jgi:hypothetical protein
LFNIQRLMNKILKTSVLMTALFSQTFSYADRKWNDANDPRNLDRNYNFNFSQLPTHGDVSNTNRGWSSSYFPKTRGYIAERWQDPRYSGVMKFKDYPLPNSYSISKMSQEELNLLSPAEKLDVARGRYDFPLATELRQDTPNPKNDWWRGLCGGWTHASVNIDEPHPIVYTNPTTKISLKINSGDIKGMMAYYYAYRDRSTFPGERNSARYLGKSCRPGKKLLMGLDGSCSDINAGAFHVALTNEIGIKKNAMAIDRDPTVQVWNQPFVKYSSVVDRVENASSKASEGTAKEVYVTTVVTFANEQYKISASEVKPGRTEEDYEDDEHVAPTAEAILGTDLQEYRTKTYKYVLELDSRDQIIGGDWIYGSDPHPDMIWKQAFALPGIGYGKDNRADDWSVLKDIILQATAYAMPKKN